MVKRYKNQKQYRYKGYDYSQDGFYFVTICTEGQEEFFGDVIDGKMVLSEVGKIADKFWREIARHFLFVKLDEYIVMPNHVHGIIQIDNNSSRRDKALPCSSIKIKKRTGQDIKERTGEDIKERTGEDIKERTGEDIKERTGQCPVRTGADEFWRRGALPCSLYKTQTNTENYKSKFGHLKSKSLSSIVGSYKSIATKMINLQMPKYEFAWHPRFHDRIIRNNDELNKIRQYIIINPEKWEFDRNNPDNDTY